MKLTASTMTTASISTATNSPTDRAHRARLVLHLRDLDAHGQLGLGRCTACRSALPSG
jgi:hypothetical protein